MNLPNITNLGTNAFRQSSGITTVEIGSGITDIFGAVFNTSIQSLTINRTTPPAIYLVGNTNYPLSGNYPIYVPCESLNAYKSSWSNYNYLMDRLQPIGECPSGNSFVVRLTLNNKDPYVVECSGSSVINWNTFIFIL